MTKYHVGCGLARIYAGTFKKPGEWKEKSDVTDDAVAAVAQYLLSSRSGFKFNYDGVRYRLGVTEVYPNIEM